MTAADRIAGYRRFLEERDGAADLYRDTLARREELFRGIEAHPVRSRRVFDRATFLRNLRRRRPEPGLDERMLWLLATAKANQGERFGVDLGRLYGRGPDEDADPEQIHVVLQETYHTRILADVVAIFGLPVPRQAPPLATRLFIQLMVRNPFPHRVALPLIGMSEMLGCSMFRLLCDRGLELFADEPEVAERIRLLYDEILADEICHVGLALATLGRWGRFVTRVLYRGLGPRLPARMAPEYALLFGELELKRAVRARFDQRAWAERFPAKAYAF